VTASVVVMAVVVAALVGGMAGTMGAVGASQEPAVLRLFPVVRLDKTAPPLAQIIIYGNYARYPPLEAIICRIPPKIKVTTISQAKSDSNQRKEGRNYGDSQKDLVESIPVVRFTVWAVVLDFLCRTLMKPPTQISSPTTHCITEPTVGSNSRRPI
jgi:hypothetical protein